MPSSHAPATGDEMEGGARSSKIDSGYHGVQSMVIDSEFDQHDNNPSEGNEASDDDESEEKEQHQQSVKKNQEQTRADEESSEEEEEGEEDDNDSDGDDSDDDSSSSLGIDLSNYYTREEADKMLQESIEAAKKAL